jgi:hypothetical protein
MDYNGGVALYKYQWDMMRYPPIVIGMFESDAEAAAKWTLIDEKHTRLFNHIYENHNETKFTYLNKVNILKETGLESFDLDYTSDEDKEWISSWKIRVTDFMPALSDELDRIKNTKKGNKISQISIKQKRIYLGRFEYEGKIYPIAMYGNGTAQDMLKAFTKVEVTELDQLQDEENKKHIYVEETYTKYFIIALYEEGRSEPSVIMQIEKFVWANSLEKWLKFLKILVDEIEETSETIFLEQITYVSQFDEDIFGECTGCWPITACCRRATEYMMGNTNIANCQDSVIALSAPYMTVTEKIVMASFSDNESTYSKESYNAASLSFDSDKAKNASDYMMERLRDNKPVLIGVHYTNGGKPPNNSNKATRHFMVVVGVTVRGNTREFRFYDPGRSAANESSAISEDNLLKYDSESQKIQGSYNGETYTITEVVKVQ